MGEIFSNNIDTQDNINQLKQKETQEILKMLDTKEGKEEFIKNLFASKEHFTEIFWKKLFKEQFKENGEEIVDALLKFCKSIDVQEFNKMSLDDQYLYFKNFLGGKLSELDLYREIELINAYINYDLMKKDTIYIEKILASVSEKQMTNLEAVKQARLARFAYADIEIDEKTQEITFLNNDIQKAKELIALLDIQNGNIRNLKDIDETKITLNQKIFLEYLRSGREEDLLDIHVSDGKIMIADNRVPDEIKQLLSGKINYNPGYKIGEIYANNDIKNDYQIDGLKITEEVNILNLLLTIFTKYSRKENIKNYKKDYKEVIENNYKILSQVSESNGFSAIIMEDKQTKDIVITVRGTNDLTDVFFSDLQIGLNDKNLGNYMPSQIKSLKKLLIEINKKYKDKKIKIVGHSLGGYLSEVSEGLKVKNIDSTFSFNGPGGGDTKLDYKDKIGANCTKFKTNEFVSNTGEDTSKYLVSVPGNKHSIDSVIKNIPKLNENKESFIPIINTSKLKDIL